jgi:signal transduction histidine kinase
MARIGARVHDDFNLIRWFSLTTLASVVTVSAVAAWALANFLTDRMIRQDAEITAGFVRSIVATENAYDFFSGATGAGTQPFQDFLGHVNRIPGVLRINVYSADRRMVWSSDASLMGKRFEHNEELDEALSADLVVHSGVVDPSHLVKSEHQHLGDGHKQFVESYVPIFDVHGRRIVGVVELYKVPADLFETLAEGRRLIWLAAVVAAAFLYAALFWIVLRAQRIIEIQGDRLVESESLAVVGEMGSAVAHGLRNPLAAIRSSAELALESPLPDQARECAQDIVAQVDRLEGWVRQLLTYAKPAHAALEPVDLAALFAEVAETYRRDLERRGIGVSVEAAPDLPKVRGDVALLTQMLGSLVVNAGEAMTGSGHIVLFGRRLGAECIAEVRDDGPGITPAEAGRVFKPFYTTKPKGLGLGLPLVRRLVERFGGSVELESAPGKGTLVRLHLPVWE